MIAYKKEVLELKRKIKLRMEELKPAVEEAAQLQETLDIIEAANKAIDKASKIEQPKSRKQNIDRWASTLDFDELVGANDLVHEFGLSKSYARATLERLAKEGVLEKWGRGKWRRKPDKKGEARLRVLTA